MPEPRRRLRSTALIVAAVLAAGAFAGAMTALAEWIASPHVGLENVPADAEPALTAPAPPTRTSDRGDDHGRDDHRGRGHDDDHDDD